MVCKICGAREHYTVNCPFTPVRIERIQKSIQIENILKEEFGEEVDRQGLALRSFSFKVSNVAHRIASLFK